ncbi:MAG: pyrroline-5-carboxylate reductase [Gammaproteobacteria bacterium]|nr:pyrroline-5-carboxylate reductase [Gammaproteobacteria bacterium]
MKSKITFIGGGNMATSLIAGLISNDFAATDIHVAEPDQKKGAALQKQYGIQAYTDNKQAIAEASIIVLAVKPQVMQTVCKDIADVVQSTQALVISIAAGLLSKDISRWLGGNISMVRCMPNTPSLLNCGATGLFANDKVSSEQKQQADQILATAGINVWVDNERQLDAVTAVSGSGPAYYFLFMEAMQNAAEKLGLNKQQAKQLSLQTALGAARMAIESDEDVAILRAKVTSKGGTTEQAIKTFEASGLPDIVMQAMQAANDKAIDLAEILGKDE